ncbi:DNA translocase FtsK, partial [Aliarcobacter butzleri]
REVQYDMNFIKDRASSSLSISSNGGTNTDLTELVDLYEDAKEVVLAERKTSISYIQRRLRIGYNRAASIVEQLEQTGV